MIEEMNIKMIDCNTGRTAVPWYGSTAISIYMFMYDPMFCKMLDCRETGTLKHWNIQTLECWNVGMLEHQNVGIQEYLYTGTSEYRNVRKNVRFVQDILDATGNQTNKRTNNGINSRMYHYINK
jgi:hypothetical protein